MSIEIGKDLDDVEVALDLTPDLPGLWADPHQLHQVVVNLVSNAHHAMRESPPPRQLILRTRHDAVARRVSLEVMDTGPGIPAEIQRRIFEPFFTTKPPGQGTGLGLALCQSIIDGHGGSVAMRSQPGQGTTFVIELPVTTAPDVLPEGRAAEHCPPIVGKSILIVEDEPEIAQVLIDLLAEDDHRVETAANGRLALEKLQRVSTI